MSAKPSFKVGLVQMSMSARPEENVAKAVEQGARSGGARRRGGVPARDVPHAVLLPEGRPRELRARGDRARAEHARRSAAPRSRRASRWWCRSSSAGRPASTTTARSSSTPTARSRASTARCTSRTTRSSTRSSTSRRATSASGLRRRRRAGSARSSAGTSGTPRARGSRRCAARPCSSTRRRSAGTRARRPSTASRSARAWQTIQRSHAIANGVYVAVVNRVGHEGRPRAATGSSSGARRFLADPFGVVIAEASTDREEILVGEVSLRAHRRGAPHWPFLRDRRIDAYGGIDRRFLDRE